MKCNLYIFLRERERERKQKKTPKHATRKKAKIIHKYIKISLLFNFFHECTQQAVIQTKEHEIHMEKRRKYEICHIHQRYEVSLIKFLRYSVAIEFYMSRLGNVCVCML